MGASGWDYFVPYEKNISAALQKLRQQVFVRGDYTVGIGASQEELKTMARELAPELDPWLEKCREIAACMPEPFKKIYLESAEKFKREALKMGTEPPPPEPKPRTIEEALEMEPESGTHSILDILRISPKPKFASISPFPRSKLCEYFGSGTPTHDQITAVYESGKLEEFVSEPWQGTYIVAYRNGSPDEIFFAGCSGD